MFLIFLWDAYVMYIECVHLGIHVFVGACMYECMSMEAQSCCFLLLLSTLLLRQALQLHLCSVLKRL